MKVKYGRKSIVLISFTWLLLLNIALFPTKTLSQGYPDEQEKVGVSAQAAILIDADSKRVLMKKNSNTPLRIASITKIMTAIIAIEHENLHRLVRTSRRAYQKEGSSIYLKLGEKLTLEDMIYGMMLRSGNDAAVAIAEYVGGSVGGFVHLMNQKAQELGMTKTVFSNPHGLDDSEEHYSSARDMAILTAYAMKNKKFAKIVGTKRKTAPLEGEEWDRIWYNKNRLLSKYPYADGVKTGYTKRAKRTLVSSATKDGYRLIAVTLNASDDWNDHIKMFEYGFQHFSPITLNKKGERIRDQLFSRSIRDAESEKSSRSEGIFRCINSFKYPLAKDETIERKIILHPNFIKKNMDIKREKKSAIPYPAGYIQYYLHGREVGRTYLQFILPKKEKNSLWNTFWGVIEHALVGN